MSGRKIEAMHRLYGVDPIDRTCDDCPHCVRYTPTDRHFYKCSLYGVTSGESTDWRLKWRACTLIDHDPEPDNFTVVIERLKHGPRPKIVEQIPGQIAFEIEGRAVE